LFAEGAGQNLLSGGEGATDASGNKRYGDIGLFLKDKINAFFKERRFECNLKYIDPSYIIRSVPANAQDNVYCSQLASTQSTPPWRARPPCWSAAGTAPFVHLPIALATRAAKKSTPPANSGTPSSKAPASQRG